MHRQRQVALFVTAETSHVAAFCPTAVEFTTTTCQLVTTMSAPAKNE
jgi:hypothetical protein